MTTRSSLKLVLFGLLSLCLFVLFVALGTWQVERRAWKLDLIERVEQRLAAEPVAAPARAEWAGFDAAQNEYLKVQLSGTFDHAGEALVQAVTERGPGFWVLTPLQRVDGSVVLINRGFVDAEHRDPATRAAGQIEGETTVQGLLRRSEPAGGFLRKNDPALDRWFSRDVAAIATARGLPLANTAPYFVDADATPNAGGWPVGGLTVVRFHNSHLVYLLTWYGLAALVLIAAIIVGRHEWRLRQPGAR